jgi:hypothetical protein
MLFAQEIMPLYTAGGEQVNIATPIGQETKIYNQM